MVKVLWAPLLTLLMTSFCHQAKALDSTSDTPVLKVAVTDLPPYSYKKSNSEWTGLSIELWEEIARKCNIHFKYVETSYQNFFPSLRDGICDVALNISFSDDKLGLISFTEPLAVTHGSLAVRRHSTFENAVDLISSAFNYQTITLLTVMVVVMLFFSILLLLIERKYQGNHFSGSCLNGLGSALWFSAVTMTSVGYGDKTPVSALGRCITFFWMMFGVLVIAIFTGSISSSLTIAEFNAGNVSAEDLSNYKTGVINNGRIYDLLKKRGIDFVTYSTHDEAIIALKEGKQINALATDDNFLRYEMNHNYKGMFLIKNIPSLELYITFATRNNLPEYDEISKMLSEITLQPEWYAQKERWLANKSL